MPELPPLRVARLSLLLSLLLLLLQAPTAARAHRISKSCTSTCDFHLCSPAKLSLLSAPYKPATPPICLEGRPVHVTSSGEAFVRSGASYYSLISRTSPTSRKSKPCAPNFFATFPTESGAAAVGFQPSSATDYSFLAGKCVSLPLNTVQLVSPTGAVLYEMQLEGRPLKDCVGFEVDKHVPRSLPSAPYATPASAASTAQTSSGTVSTPASEQDDVADGGRSALDARKRIMDSLGRRPRPSRAQQTRAPASVLAVDGEPAASTEAAEEEAEASAEPSAEPSAEASAEPSEWAADRDEDELLEAVPFGALDV